MTPSNSSCSRHCRRGILRNPAIAWPQDAASAHCEGYKKLTHPLNGAAPLGGADFVQAYALLHTPVRKGGWIQAALFLWATKAANRAAWADIFVALRRRRRRCSNIAQ